MCMCLWGFYDGYVPLTPYFTIPIPTSHLVSPVTLSNPCGNMVDTGAKALETTWH